MKVYIDSDILIWHLRGDKNALRFLQDVASRPDLELWTGVMQRAEVVFHMRPEEEEDTLLLLSQFQTAPLDQDRIDLAAKLYRQWHPSHGVDVHDAILAATAMRTGGKIYSLNKKHYPMTDIVVEKPW